MSEFVLLSLWPQWRLRGGLWQYHIRITVSAQTKGTILPPVRCEQWVRHMLGHGATAVWAARVAQVRDHAAPILAPSQAEPRGTLADTFTGTTEYGQDTHAQDRSVQVWIPSKYPLKWQDESQLSSEETNTVNHVSKAVCPRQCPDSLD